jgi:hypothetical protein
LQEIILWNKKQKPPLNLFKGGFAGIVGMAGRQSTSIFY